MKLTKEQLHILQHSLGVDQYGRGDMYRNHFVSGAACDNFKTIEGLVSLGLMTESKRYGFMSESDRCFHVTNKGIATVLEHSPKPPKVSKGRRRYMAFRNLKACWRDLTFHEFLTSPIFKEERENA